MTRSITLFSVLVIGCTGDPTVDVQDTPSTADTSTTGGSTPAGSASVEIDGAQTLSFDTVVGSVNSNYEVTPTPFVSFDATTATAPKDRLVVSLADLDKSVQFFYGAASFDVGGTESDASIAVTQGATTYTADSGTASVTEFRLPNPKSSVVILSGTFSVSAAGTPLVGTFDDVALDCKECGG